MKRTQVFFIIAAALWVSAYADDSPKVISQVQAKLGVPVDGKLGPKTEAALRHFQHTKGLAATGELHQPTRKALGLTGPQPKPLASAAARSEAGKMTTPVGPAQSSAERTAEPKTEPAKPTGEKTD
jgi:peptidoglycan hydrolase-like protein with peptidoglycan-binding domain